jgi:hypothetical protein
MSLEACIHLWLVTYHQISHSRYTLHTDTDASHWRLEGGITSKEPELEGTTQYPAVV